ncbi:MAG: DUF2797 domain-containing protein [Gammaproteobacteria bacterium]
MTLLASGPLTKMKVAFDQPVRYALVSGDGEVAMNGLLGEKLSLKFAGAIRCIHCGRPTKKSFNQGYCYPCFASLARCDLCIVRPEQCHFDAGTCREPEWAQGHCMQDHVVYLANSSGLKVGITRKTQIPTRWIDQGAVQALAILEVRSRFQAGLIEVILKAHVSDKTGWQKMLKGESAPVDLESERDRLLGLTLNRIEALRDRFGVDFMKVPANTTPLAIRYPVIEYPRTVKSFNLDRIADLSGVLHGIKGQYLIFDKGVINIRKFGGYVVDLLRH